MADGQITDLKVNFKRLKYLCSLLPNSAKDPYRILSDLPSKYVHSSVALCHLHCCHLGLSGFVSCLSYCSHVLVGPFFFHLLLFTLAPLPGIVDCSGGNLVKYNSDRVTFIYFFLCLKSSSGSTVDSE